MKRKEIVFLMISLIFIACNPDKNKFKTHESGLEYKIVTSEDGVKPKIGDVLVLNYSYETEDGKEIFNSAEAERKYLKKLEAPKHTGGSIEDGLALMTVGDSAVFRLNAESFLKFSESYSKLPDGISSEDKIIVKVKLLEILLHEEFDSHLSEKYHATEDIEMELLSKYLKNANITVEPCESGMYYVEQYKGTGKNIKPGDVVSVNYTVKLVDGQVLETTYNRAPMSFKYGEDQMIDAWNEGISKMNEGGRAMFICPSKIAYGAEGTSDIPPYSTLIFEVEVINVQR
ncbi:MAG: FKBP-type peptidyl-prolyl cis-trans isomerase [Bacteroidales bacterium]|nr:FKBP-type peptidyl-prolyl cis-trans isomerase [Bacteroidales bacterium]